jgi:hypothetical protein
MKNLITVLLISLTISAAAAQDFQNNRKDETASIVSVSGSYVNSKVYLKCLLKDQRKNGFLVFEVFRNGKFEYLGNTPVVGVPIETPLLYCFNYSDPNFESSQFRVTCITPDQPRLISNPITVEAPVKEKETADAPKSYFVKPATE